MISTSAPERPRAAALRLSVAGSAAVATAFGMARYGYGLLLPDIQDDLGLTAAVLGTIGALAYVAYIASTTLVAQCIRRVGQRATVAAGGLLAVTGTVVIALADGPVLLGAGVAIAGASAGLIQPPFADAVERLAVTVRARALTTISCGTGWGVALAAPVAVAAGQGWRTAFLGFAGCATVSTLFAVYVLPDRRSHDHGMPRQRTTANAPPRRRRAPRLSRPVLPLVSGALLIGLGSAPFWTFAVDAVREGGLDQTAARVMLGVAGVASLLGSGAADVIRRLGAAWTFVLAALLEAAAIATIALAADQIVVVMIAAAAFGAAYNTIVNVTVLRGTQLYPQQPSAGSAVVLRAQAIGLLCGPLIGGVIADAVGLPATLAAGAAVVLTATVFAPRGDDLIRPATP